MKCCNGALISKVVFSFICNDTDTLAEERDIYGAIKKKRTLVKKVQNAYRYSCTILV